MTHEVRGPSGPVGPVLVGVLGAEPAEEALRQAFAEAAERDADLLVLLTGEVPAEDDIHRGEVVHRWAEKNPEVAVRTIVRRHLDPAVVIAAASQGCGRLVVQHPVDPTGAALVAALSRRARCPVMIAHPGPIGPVTTGAGPIVIDRDGRPGDRR